MGFCAILSYIAHPLNLNFKSKWSFISFAFLIFTWFLLISRIIVIKFCCIINFWYSETCLYTSYVKYPLFFSIRAAVDDGFVLATTNKHAFIVHPWSPADSIHCTVVLSRLHLLTTNKIHKQNDNSTDFLSQKIFKSLILFHIILQFRLLLQFKHVIIFHYHHYRHHLMTP